MRRHVKGVAVSGLLASFWLAACGGGGDGGGGSTPGTFGNVESLAAAIDSPTGTVDETTAGAVAEEFETQMSSDVSGLGGIRENVGTVRQAQTSTIDCSGGGNISVDGDETRASFRYNACNESGCLFNGEGVVFASGAGDYSSCLSYDISATCDDGTSAQVTYSGCLGSEGEFVYLIEVEGESYTVSGYYSDGNGELTIRGANGTFTCTYTEGSGTCVGDGGDEFEF